MKRSPGMPARFLMKGVFIYIYIYFFLDASILKALNCVISLYMD